MSGTTSILAPLGWVYGLLAAVRRGAYRREMLPRWRLSSPVISVGGLAMGGSMKTPVVVEIARALRERGPAVGVLGHGYRGRDGKPRLVSDGAKPLETAETAGDEAMLLAHELPGCPVAVGKDKVAAARLLEERFGRLIIVVDSGFQHQRLFRDLDIVCVSEVELGGRVLPAGILREFPRALKAADLIFTDRITDGPLVARLRARRPKDVYSMERKDFGFFPFEGGGPEMEAPARAYVLCGIGRPERFLKDVASRGVTLTGQRRFRDHHPYSAQDLKDVVAAAEKTGASAVVTTSKDAVRIDQWPGPLPLMVLSARLEIESFPAILKRIDQIVLARIKAGK